MKIFKHIALVLTALLLASCQKEGAAGIVPGDECTVEYSVSLDQVTKASGEDISVTHIWYAAYKMEGNSLTLKAEYDLAEIVDGKASCPVKLVRGNSYKIVFVAQHYDENSRPAYEIDAEKQKLIMPGEAVANSDDYEMFWTVDDVIEFNGEPMDPVSLDRKVAKISFYATDEAWAAAESAGQKPTQCAMTISNIPESMSLIDGTRSQAIKTVNYSKSPLASSGNILGTVYCLAGSQNVNIGLTIYKGDDGNELIKTINALDIPIKENFKINIQAEIL